jgi:hypothetical protein
MTIHVGVRVTGGRASYSRLSLSMINILMDPTGGSISEFYERIYDRSRRDGEKHKDSED